MTQFSGMTINWVKLVWASHGDPPGDQVVRLAFLSFIYSSWVGIHFITALSGAVAGLGCKETAGDPLAAALHLRDGHGVPDSRRCRREWFLEPSKLWAFGVVLSRFCALRFVCSFSSQYPFFFSPAIVWHSLCNQLKWSRSDFAAIARWFCSAFAAICSDCAAIEQLSLYGSEAISQRLRGDFVAIAQRLLIDVAAISQKFYSELRSDCAAIAQLLHGDCKVIAQRLSCGCTAISSRFCIDCAAISKRFRSDFAVIT
jgi:hypothetical protein